MLDIIYGVNAVEMAIEHHKVKKIFADLSPNHKIIEKAKVKNIRIFSLEEFNDYEKYRDKCQKVIAIIEPYKYYELNQIFIDRPKNVLFLDQIKDQQNLGAIIRSALAFGIEHIIIPKTNSASINETTHKTSAGSTFLAKIIKVTSIQNVIKKMKQENYWVASLDMDGNISIENLKKQNLNLLIVLGSEGEGVRQSILNESDFICSIKINNKIDSLNVSVATGIVLYEITK